MLSAIRQGFSELASHQSPPESSAEWSSGGFIGTKGDGLEPPTARRQTSRGLSTRCVEDGVFSTLTNLGRAKIENISAPKETRIPFSGP